eukprot:g32319.t1
MVEQQWQEFLGVIQEAQQEFIPRKKKQTKGRMRQPWLTMEVRDSIKANEKAYNVVQVEDTNSTPELHESQGAEVAVVIITKEEDAGEGNEQVRQKRAVLDVIYLDFQKVMDRVLHRMLLNKIRAHGVGSNRGADQGVPEGMVLAKVDKGGEGNVSGGGIPLEVMEIVANGCLDVDAAGIV